MSHRQRLICLILSHLGYSIVPALPTVFAWLPDCVALTHVMSHEDSFFEAKCQPCAGSALRPMGMHDERQADPQTTDGDDAAQPGDDRSRAEQPTGSAPTYTQRCRRRAAATGCWIPGTFGDSCRAAELRLQIARAGRGRFHRGTDAMRGRTRR